MISELNDYFSSKCSLQAYYTLEQKNISLSSDLASLQKETSELQQQYDVLLDQNIQIDEAS